MAAIDEDWQVNPSRFDFFVVSPGDVAVARKYTRVVFVHPNSGAVVLARAP